MLIVLPLKNAESLKAFFSFETCKYCVGDLDSLKNIVFLLKLEHIKSFVRFTKLPATFWLELCVCVIPVETWFPIVAVWYVTV